MRYLTQRWTTWQIYVRSFQSVPGAWWLSGPLWAELPRQAEDEAAEEVRRQPLTAAKLAGWPTAVGWDWANLLSRSTVTARDNG